MKTPLAIASLLLFCGTTPGQDTVPEAEFPFYVGRTVCLECHASGLMAGVCTLEAIPEHDESYQALTKPQAESIVTLSGISVSPTQSPVCLFCHATAADVGPRWTRDKFRIEDGVQCEACHDAGSFHVEAYRSDDGRALPPGERRIRRGTLETCVPCHVDMPTHQEVLDKGFALTESDRQYKTPVNLAISPDGKRLYVACEHSDSLVVVDTAQNEVVDEIAVGRRPQDVAVSPDGRIVYVSNRMSDSLSVVDTVAGEVVQEIAVGHEPHGVFLDPIGRRVFVLCTGSDSISVVDVDRMIETKRLVAGVGPWSIAVGLGGKRCYATSVRPNPGRFREPPVSEVTVLDVERGIVVDRWMVPGANMLQGIAVVPGSDVAIFTMMRTKNLIPTTRLAQGWTITNGLGVVGSDGRVDQVLLDRPNAYLPDLMDVAINPNGRTALVVSGGSDQVVAVDIPALLKAITGRSDRDRAEVLPNHLGVSSEFVTKRVAVGANPRAVVFAPDGRFAYVANALDDSVTVLDALDLTVVNTVRLGGPTELTQIRWGERLFHNADITFGRQFSCRSCHPDGHLNGLTIDIEADGVGFHPVDNRTLRGILDTAPFKWEGTNPSLHRQCGPRLAVFFTRLAPYRPDELDALVRYMCTIEQPRNPYRSPDGLTLAQRRGKAVFERTTMNNGTVLKPELQCLTCHGSAYMTSRETTAVSSTMWFDAPVVVELNERNMFDADEFGAMGIYYFIDAGMPSAEFDAPHLRNIYASPPYLHNGIGTTLEELWTIFNMVDRHGMAQDYTRQQINDLVEYLKAL